MKRLLLQGLGVLGLVLVLLLAVLRDPGYVLVSWQQTSVEMSLVLAILLWFLSLFLVLIVLRLLGRPVTRA